MSQHSSTETMTNSTLKNNDSIESHTAIQPSEDSGDGYDVVDARGETEIARSLEKEENRLDTFKNWTKSDIVTPWQLARSGFSYLGPDDYVQCFMCKLVLHNWVLDDDVNTEHGKNSPKCPHLATVSNMAPLPSLSNPKDPAMKAEQPRLASFTNWPVQLRQRPEELSRAGFYYTGTGDSVSCFFCGLKIHKWSLDDNVWEEHVRWSPDCALLQHLRGQHYVQQVRHKLSQSPKQPEPSPGATSPSDISPLVKEIMKGEITKAVISSKYSAELVRRTIAKHLLSGAEFEDADQLMAAVKMTEAEEAVNQASSSASSTQPVTRPTSTSAQEEEISSDSEGYDIPPNEELAWQRNQNSDRHNETSPTPMDVTPSQPKQVPSETQHENLPPRVTEMSASGETPQGAESVLCCICMDRKRSMAFLPCGHFVVCEVCAAQCDNCPICRQPPTAKTRIFES